MSDYLIFNKKICEFIQDKLPKVDDTEYKIRIFSGYDYTQLQYDIICDVDIIKTVSAQIKIPTNLIINNDTSAIEDKLAVLAISLGEKITGTPVERSYFEINGIKYYPEKREVI